MQYIIGYIDDNIILCNLLNDTPTHMLLQTATTVIQSWQRLLRHTGGDLSLPKYLFTIVTWISTNKGDLKMASIQESPGNLIIQNTPTSNECIRRVEPEYAERILGVRMSATEKMKIEFDFRLVQARELAVHIRRAPLARIEAEAEYRHWIPIASYCLPITIFDIKQANK